MRGRKLLLLLTLVLLTHASDGFAYPLSDTQATCLNRYNRASTRVLKFYGKTVNRCLRSMGSGRSRSIDVSDCLLEDPKGKLARMTRRMERDVDRFCLAPPTSAMVCPAPCDTMNVSGSAEIESLTDLKRCLACLNPAASWMGPEAAMLPHGTHGRVLQGATVTPPAVDSATASCQAGLIRANEGLFAASVREASACIERASRRPSTTVAPTHCVDATPGQRRVFKMKERLEIAVDRCGAMVPFDGGACAGISGHPALTECLDAAQKCGTCIWGRGLLGMGLECDLFDDGLSNGSCMPGVAATTTTSLLPSTTIVTTTLEPVTTTLPPVTTTLAPVTTTTLPSGPCGTFVDSFGSAGTANGAFDGPRGIGISASGDAYVVDSRNDRVQVFSPAGDFLMRWGSFGEGGGEFDRPRALAVGPLGNVYVVDRSNHRVQKFGPGGNYLAEWGGLGALPGQFNLPQGIAVDSAGDVYVSDGGNQRIQKFTSTGTYLLQWGAAGTLNGQFLAPRGVAADASGHVYVVDRQNHAVQKFTSNGQFVTRWGGLGSSRGRFNAPRGIAVDAAGDVLVVDTGNHRVQKFTAEGGFIDAFGVFGIGPVQFNQPYDIAIAGDGTVYISDRENNRVQRILCAAE